MKLTKWYVSEKGPFASDSFVVAVVVPDTVLVDDAVVVVVVAADAVVVVVRGQTLFGRSSKCGTRINERSMLLETVKPRITTLKDITPASNFFHFAHLTF